MPIPRSPRRPARRFGAFAALALSAVILTGCDPSSNGFSPGNQARVDSTGVTPEARRLAEQVGGFVSASTPGTAAYKVGPQDVLEVVVYKVPDLTRSIQVSEGGTINLPLVGDLPAAGRTAQQIEQDVAGRLNARYVKNPQVNIYVKEFNSQRVTVEGAVKMPGVFPLRGKMTLMQSLALAQGVNGDLASGEVMVFRTNGGERVGGQFDLEAIRTGQASDPLIVNGDVIVVPSSTTKVAFNNFTKITPLLAAFRPTIF